MSGSASGGHHLRQCVIPVFPPRCVSCMTVGCGWNLIGVIHCDLLGHLGGSRHLARGQNSHGLPLREEMGPNPGDQDIQEETLGRRGQELPPPLGLPTLGMDKKPKA